MRGKKRSGVSLEGEPQQLAGNSKKNAGAVEGSKKVGGSNGSVARIGDQFRELKEKLKDVTEDQWASIPDVGDYSLRYKQKRRQDVFTPITDSLLESRAVINDDATAGNSTLAGTTQTTSSTSDNKSGLQSLVVNMSGLAEARGTVLGMSLDKMSDSVSGQTTIDPKGYLTSLSNTQISTAAEVGDIHKARQLLKSVRDTNPRHAPGWIAAARVEEAAGKTLHARRLIQEACAACPDSEDVWLEAARLHPPATAKTVLASAVRRNPHNSVRIFLRASELENNAAAKKGVLRKGLECNPTSVALWKAAIELEDEDDARVLLAVAVEKVPHAVDLWLALARLESYPNARRVLNRARRALPAERSVWIAAAKLEESQNHGDDVVSSIVDKAVASLAKNDAVVSRAQWLAEAEAAEAAGAPGTAEAIVRCTVGIGVDVEDRVRTWADDADAALTRGAVATARAILAYGLVKYPLKRGLWLQAVELERKHGGVDALDEVLAAASERLPKQEIFWLVRAKGRWLEGDVDKARDILGMAFEANPNSEPVWLAAAKLEWETGEIDRARVLLSRARERASSDRVYMKSALLERECKKFEDALKLIQSGLKKYPNFAKLYMMGGQICSEDLEDRTKEHLDRARAFYRRGLQKCPTSVVLWILASRLEETAPSFLLARSKTNNGNTTTTNNNNGISPATGTGFTKARSLLELARLKNPKNPDLWIEAVRLERRAGNEKLGATLIARALQECPHSGRLLAETIATAPRVEQKSRSADAIKRCPDDPHVNTAVANLFASERKNAKARKWYERAVVLDPDLGDSWVGYYVLEMEVGGKEERDAVRERCVAAEPKHGEMWCEAVKHMKNRGKTVAECLELMVQELIRQRRLN